VISTEILPDYDFAKEYNVTFVPLEELLQKSDIVTLHVPKTPVTKNLIRKETIALMKPSAIVLNTSRGGVVHEKDLYDALVAKKIAAAGLDVFEVEPLRSNSLCALDNIILTAHTAGVDEQSRQDMARLPANAIVKLLAGEWPADWVVNPQVKEKFFARK
jgi:phosphoglycerate dehydrogenase-like enzyme